MNTALETRENEKTPLMPTDSTLPQTVKYGRSEYVIVRHYCNNRTVTDALYELLRLAGNMPSEPLSKPYEFKVPAQQHKSNETNIA